MGRMVQLGACVLILLALGSGCARSPEASKARHISRGDKYYQQQKYREAILEYSNALRIDQADGKAIRQLAFAHYELGELREALRYLLKADQLQPGTTDVQLKLGHIYLVGGHPDEARARAEAVLQRLPKNLDALVLVAGTARTPEELADVIQRLTVARADLERSAKFHLTLAGLYLRTGDVAGAETALQEAIKREPKSVEAHSALGNFFVAKRDTAQAERELKLAADLAGLESPAQVRLADFYLLVGRPDDAKRILGEITTKAPDYLPAWRLLANVAFDEERIDASAQAVQMVLKKSPSDVEARTLLGRIHLARGRSQEAITEFQRILKNQPRLAPVHHQLALAHLRAGNMQQAKTELREALTIAPGFAEPVLLLAKLNVESGGTAAAIDDLEKLLKIYPDDARALALVATAYLKHRDLARGLQRARRLVAVAPQNPSGPYLAGVALLAQGRRSEGRQQLEAALALAPASVDPLVQLVGADLADKQSEAALRRVMHQAALAPSSGAHQALLGKLYLLRDERGLAEGALLKAIDLSPGLLDPYVGLGTLYAKARRYDDAVSMLAEAAKLNPNDPAPLMMAGVVHEQKGDIAKARAAYERALALDGRLAPAANNLAWIYSEHGGDRDKALKLAQTAKDLAPDDPRISDTLGWILYRRGAYQRARKLLEESATKLPDNPQVHYHLGMVYAQLGDRENARKNLTRAVDSPENFPGKDEARNRLGDVSRQGLQRFSAP